MTMKRKDVIGLAHLSDLRLILGPLDSLSDDDWNDLHRFAALVAAVEREACAIAAWSKGMDLHMKQHDAREVGAAAAAAIRARGETK